MSIDADLRIEIELLNLAREQMAKGRIDPIIGDRTFYQLTRMFEGNITQLLKLKLKYGGY